MQIDSMYEIKGHNTLCFNLCTSCFVRVSALAITGTMFTLWSTAFINLTSSGFNLQHEINAVLEGSYTYELQWNPDNSHKKYAKILCELSRMCELFIHQSQWSQWGSIQSSE